MRLVYMMSLIIAVCCLLPLARTQLILPKFRAPNFELLSETDNTCHVALLKAAWKLFDVVHHWNTNWLLLFDDIKDFCILLKDVVLNCWF